MARKFISILGAGRYTKVNYYYKTQDNNRTTKYIQHAIIDLFCRKWDNNDQIIIFTTRKSEKMHWNKLNSIITDLDLSCKHKNIKIPDGQKGEKDIWRIFDLFADSIQSDDEIIFDITHAYRFIPMLGITALNYLKSIKNIQILNILYGAIEPLGDIRKIKDIPLKMRKAPIYDLTPLDSINEWANAVTVFQQTGNINFLKNKIEKNINPVLKETKGKDKQAQRINIIDNYLNSISKNISTVRGNAIYNNKGFNKFLKNFETLKSNEIKFKPIKHLMNIVIDKFTKFTTKTISNLIYAVKICLQNNMYQQAITLCHESLICIVCNEANINWHIQKNREIVSKAFKIKSLSLDNREDKWKIDRTDYDVLKHILQLKILNKTYKNFEKLRSIRNDINHGGFLNDFNKNEKAINYQSLINKAEKIIYDLMNNLEYIMGENNG